MDSMQGVEGFEGLGLWSVALGFGLGVCGFRFFLGFGLYPEAP